MLLVAMQSAVGIKQLFEQELYSQVIDAAAVLKQQELTPEIALMLAQSYYAQNQVNNSIQTLVRLIRQKSVGQAPNETAKGLLFVYCKESCEFNCVKDLTHDYFPSIQSYNFLSREQQNRKQFLNGQYFLNQLYEFVTQVCTNDLTLKWNLVENLLYNNYYGDLQQVFGGMSLDARAQELAFLCRLLQLQAGEDYHAIASLLREKQFSEGYVEQYEKYIESIMAYKLELTSEPPRIQLLERLSAEILEQSDVFSDISETAEYLIRQLFRNQFIMPDSFCKQFQYSVMNYISQCNTFVQKIANNEEVVNVSVRDPNLMYFKLRQLNSSLLNSFKIIKNMDFETEEFEQQTDKIDQIMQKIYETVNYVASLSYNDTFKEKMNKFVEFINLQQDRLFTLKGYYIAPNPYRILNVSTDISDEELKKQYFRLARELHPDMLQNEEQHIKKQKQREFEQVADAFDTLSDPGKKLAYLNGSYFNSRMESLRNHYIERKQRATQSFANIVYYYYQ